VKDDREFSSGLLDLARKERFLLWSVDQPEYSTVSMPAVVSLGQLRVAVTTGGASPALASRIRQDLETIFGQEAADFVAWLAALRDETKKNEPDYAKRREILTTAVEDFKLTGQAAYPVAWSDHRKTGS
jgi:precorrin-2 dehydrogenase/sirohydrochlorin ferrochelatase